MAIMKRLLFILLFLPYLGFSQIKISALTEATTLNASDWFMAVQGGTTKKVAFYRFSYNQDSTALQITDSLAFYVQKTELSDSLLNYILRTELNDSLANYTSLDSLTYYMKTVDVRSEISDSLASYSFPTYGTANQVPFVNSTGTDLGYSDNFKWNDTTLTLNDGNNNIAIGYNAGKNRTYSLSNIFMGVESGLNNTEGNYNIFNGYHSGKNATVGNSNVFLGAFSGFGITTGERNIFIGYNSGYSHNGSENIFIGDNSGYNETGSNKLYIENSNSATPLIYGDFANDTVRINGKLDITSDLFNEAPHTVIYRITDTTIAATQNVWYKIGGFTQKFVPSGMTVQGDSIRIDKKGHFNIDFTISFSGFNNEIWEIAVFKNNVIEAPRQLRYTSTSDVGNMSCPVEVYSDGDDWISFRIQNTTDSDDPTIKRFSAIIKTEHLIK